jgi:hemerythrin
MLINKDALQLVTMDFMNEVHNEEIDMINELYDNLVLLCSGEDLEEKVQKDLDAWIEHTKEHFAIEEEHMKAYNFFAYDCHSKEHHRALAEFIEYVEDWKKTKDNQKLKKYFEEVVYDWLPNHVSTMDFVTSNFLSQFK